MKKKPNPTPVELVVATLIANEHGDGRIFQRGLKMSSEHYSASLEVEGPYDDYYAANIFMGEVVTAKRYIRLLKRKGWGLTKLRTKERGTKT